MPWLRSRRSLRFIVGDQHNSTSTTRERGFGPRKHGSLTGLAQRASQPSFGSLTSNREASPQSPRPRWTVNHIWLFGRWRIERGPVLCFFQRTKHPTRRALCFVRAPQRLDDRKFGSSRVLQINLPPPALSIGSRRPDHRPRQSAAFWFSRAPRRGSLQRTSHATPIFGRVRPLTLQAAQ